MGYLLLAVAAVAAAPGAASQDSRAIAVNGAIMQMVAHGLSTGALFYLAGVIAARAGTTSLNGLGGLRKHMPTLAGVMGVALFANLGLPGLAGFVGEFFIFRGAWASLPLFTALATIGLVVTALALLLMFQAIFFGPMQGEHRAPPSDLSTAELAPTLPLLALLLVLGLYPAPLLNLVNATANEFVAVFMRLLT
jgi:NADH-quinone oxidoreductase subunit M